MKLKALVYLNPKNKVSLTEQKSQCFVFAERNSFEIIYVKDYLSGATLVQGDEFAEAVIVANYDCIIEGDLERAEEIAFLEDHFIQVFSATETLDNLPELNDAIEEERDCVCNSEQFTLKY